MNKKEKEALADKIITCEHPELNVASKLVRNLVGGFVSLAVGAKVIDEISKRLK